ncbi:MAG: AbrB/MazE/SpoVT family DNA-binding domain-containing protein [Candidatus Thermoplasmatota archaeon]|nr:AbrB/MazE/SpoVT family DNA-binding domain-containing protein [Candidatus Thermoplasmatota archaeon]
MKVDLADIRCIKETALTVKGARRRITVPYEVVELLKLENGDKLRWIVFNNGMIQLQKVNSK